ncbi:hypothetical protein IGI04_000782 [Brassica rapa subsp. trilocularis]|uniref:Uncharacterized protein n=1 Tax=Brassica rapa subsp. trilocularis TaxID=1813537 RepID=A0ABQ7NT03_BRACM|nr:hypothetical protein IGI04_000782 [Brassica rapa subsp. trilocularis]
MKSKEIYRVADLGLAICFTHSSVLSDLDHMCLPIDADRFGFNLHEVLKPTMDSGVTSIKKKSEEGGGILISLMA